MGQPRKNIEHMHSNSDERQNLHTHIDTHRHTCTHTHTRTTLQAKESTSVVCMWPVGHSFVTPDQAQHVPQPLIYE